MNDIPALMEQLHDIEGIDAIAWWPPAAGWWVVMVVSLLIMWMIGWLIFRRLAFVRSWKYDTIRKLTQLEHSLDASPEAAMQETMVLFSEYLRRIAIRRFARSECAGLVGEAWLQWLSHHDEKKFDWKEKGKCLLQAPYSPLHQNVAVEQMKDLIKAAKEWVR